MYAARIDTARKAVAIAMAVCGIGAVVCIRQDDYLAGTLRYEPGIWRLGVWMFGAGVYACLVATSALVVEHLARPSVLCPFALRSYLARVSGILVAIITVGVSTTLAFGWSQGVGGVIGTILLLAALRERGSLRRPLAVSGTVVFGLILWSTQSPYQFARRNAAEIVAAGCSLLDQWPEDQFSREIQISDPRLPKVLCDLAASRVWIDERFVSVYVPAHRGFRDREFLISRPSKTNCVGDSVWIKRPSGKDDMIRISDCLWMTDY
jgi:hypothetical protein